MSPLDQFLLKPVPDVEKLYHDSRIKKEFPSILTILSLWGRNTTNLWRIHIILGTIATIFSILAAIGFTSTGFLADIPKDNSNSTIDTKILLEASKKEIEQLKTQKTASQIFGFLAAVSISLMTAFNLGAKSNNTRNAWRELNTAVMKFNQNLVEKDEVIAAYERGEAMIGGITFSKEKIETGENQPTTDNPTT